MRLTVNGVSHSVDSGTTIANLIDQLGLQERRVAVEVNRQIVPRSQHPSHPLQDGDAIELVQAIGGG
jgi:thiamine biosynthesis protein ThiS